MEQQVAETVARATREEAQLQARSDLDQLRCRAVEAGRDRSRKIIKVSVINTATGRIRYNPAGRLLRDWYLHVYINTLRADLSQPSEIVDAQQAAEVAAMLNRLRPTASPEAPKAVDVTFKLAVADADAAVARITEHLHNAGAARAIRHAPDGRFEGDQFRVHVTRHWYQRCYHDTVDQALQARHPLAAVTDAETLLVANSLASGQARRLIGRDAIPLVTAHDTAIGNLDRRLAVGRGGEVVTSPIQTAELDALATLSERLRQAWTDMGEQRRADWLEIAGAPPIPARPDWVDLNQAQQTKLVGYYLAMHRLELLVSDFDPPRIEGPPAEAARKMFNHSASLATPPATTAVEPSLGLPDLDDRSALAETRSQHLSAGR